MAESKSEPSTSSATDAATDQPSGGRKPASRVTTPKVDSKERTEGKLISTPTFTDEFHLTVDTDAEGKNGTTYVLTPAGTEVPARHVDEVINVAERHRIDLKLRKLPEGSTVDDPPAKD